MYFILYFGCASFYIVNFGHAKIFMKNNDTNILVKHLEVENKTMNCDILGLFYH